MGTRNFWMTKFGTPDATAGPGSASKKVGLLGAGEPSGLRSFWLILSSFFLTSRWGSALGALSSAFGFALSFEPVVFCAPPWSDALGAWSPESLLPPPLLGWSGLGAGAGELGAVGFGSGAGSGTVG